MDRREFARLVSLTAAAASMGAASAASPAPPLASPRSPAKKPKRLAPGDTVGLVLPATAAATMDEIAFARDQMEAIGLKVVIGKHAYDRWGYFAGHDRDRA